MPSCTTYNARNAHASPVRTKTNGKGRRAGRGVCAPTTPTPTTNASITVSAALAGKETGAINTPVALTEAKEPKEANANSGIGGSENVKPCGVVGLGAQGKLNGSAAGPLVSLTNTGSAVAEDAVKGTEKEEKGVEVADDNDDDDENENGGVEGEGEWRDKEGLAFEHARQRARKAGERAKRRARKAEMQAAAMAFVSPIADVGEERKEKREAVTTTAVNEASNGNGMHKGSRVGKVGMRKAEAGYLDLGDVNTWAVDGYFKKAQERMRSMSGDHVDFGGLVDEGRREVSLSELVYFATQKKPKKNKGHDFEMIPALKTVIVLDDVESDVSMDEAWDHIEDLSVDGREEMTYAKVVATK